MRQDYDEELALLAEKITRQEVEKQHEAFEVANGKEKLRNASAWANDPDYAPTELFEVSYSTDVAAQVRRRKSIDQGRQIEAPPRTGGRVEPDQENSIESNRAGEVEAHASINRKEVGRSRSPMLLHSSRFTRSLSPDADDAMVAMAIQARAEHTASEAALSIEQESHRDAVLHLNSLQGLARAAAQRALELQVNVLDSTEDWVRKMSEVAEGLNKRVEAHAALNSMNELEGTLFLSEALSNFALAEANEAEADTRVQHAVVEEVECAFGSVVKGTEASLEMSKAVEYEERLLDAKEKRAHLKKEALKMAKERAQIEQQRLLIDDLPEGLTLTLTLTLTLLIDDLPEGVVKEKSMSTLKKEMAAQKEEEMRILNESIAVKGLLKEAVDRVDGHVFCRERHLWRDAIASATEREMEQETWRGKIELLEDVVATQELELNERRLDCLNLTSEMTTLKDEISVGKEAIAVREQEIVSRDKEIEALSGKLSEAEAHLSELKVVLEMIEEREEERVSTEETLSARVILDTNPNPNLTWRRFYRKSRRKLKKT